MHHAFKNHLFINRFDFFKLKSIGIINYRGWGGNY